MAYASEHWRLEGVVVVGVRVVRREAQGSQLHMEPCRRSGLRSGVYGDKGDAGFLVEWGEVGSVRKVNGALAATEKQAQNVLADTEQMPGCSNG